MPDNKPNRKNTKDPRFKHLSMPTADTASATDFTGLIPANPQIAEETDAYRDIYDFGNQAAKKNKK